MKHKMLGLVVAAAGLMAFSGSASATTITSPAGTTYTSSVLSSSGVLTLAGPYVTVECQKSILQFKIETHGASVTAGGAVSGFGVSECNFSYHAISSLGSIEIHTDSASANGNGTVTSTGLAFTVTTSVGECGFKTNNTDLGTLTGGTPAVINVNAKIPRTHGSAGFLCGSTGTLNGTYTISTPGTLLVD